MRSLIQLLIPERIPWFAAGLYDRIAQDAVESYYKPVAEEIVAAMNRGLILDIGTGPGYLPIEIAKIAPQVTIQAVDLTGKMIRLARRGAREAGVSNRITFRVGDANKLRFGDDSFDMVISTGALHAWKHPVRVMRECLRVLKPGAEAWIYDPAHVVTKRTEEYLRHNLGRIDRIAYKWASWSTRGTEPLTGDRIRSILERLDCMETRVEKGRWLKIILRKHDPPARTQEQ
ncbi:MAG: class I SAM-dependent methyltransferase [Desulfomonilaceae bacterium]|nr:class I SAM-dependent methyltransferase [Desulfomonilaceae bacterium]